MSVEPIDPMPGDRGDVAGHRDQAEREGQLLDVLLAADQRAGRRVEQRVQDEAEDEEQQERAEDRQGQPLERSLAAERGRAEEQAGDPVLEQDDERGRDDDRRVLGETRAADPDDLADEELARGRGADQQLHDPGALLGGDARRDPHPVDGQGDEDEDDEDVARTDRLAICLGIDRLAAVRCPGGRDDLEGRYLERHGRPFGARRRLPVEDAGAEVATRSRAAAVGLAAESEVR